MDSLRYFICFSFFVLISDIGFFVIHEMARLSLSLGKKGGAK